MAVTVRVRSGRLLIDALTFAAYLPGQSAVVLTRRDDDLFIIPVYGSSPDDRVVGHDDAGDRVIDAGDFFASSARDERILEARWRIDIEALQIAGAFAPSAAP